jgi:hypothetical protein
MSAGRQHHFGSEQNVATSSRRRPGRARRGQSLVEFALVALVVYMLLAAILTFGHMLFVAQGAQQAVDVAAREISRTPLPADSHTLEQILRGDANSDPALVRMRQQVYDEHYLVLNLDTLHGRASLQDLIADLPVVNQQLVPLMISDQVEGTRVLRYPGAIFTDSNTADDPADPPPSGLLVAIPLVVGRDDDGVETVDWIPVVEEIEPSNESDPRRDPFRLSSELRGVVALRINYPFQSATMSSFRPRAAGDSSLGRPNAADDAGVGVVENDGFTPSGSQSQSDNEFGPYAGPFGLGQQAAMRSEEMTGLRNVRPFRRVISAQAIYRREVFSE